MYTINFTANTYVEQAACSLKAQMKERHILILIWSKQRLMIERITPMKYNFFCEESVGFAGLD